MLRKYVHFIAILIFLFVSVCYAESFRVRKVVSTQVSVEERVQKVQLSYNDALSVQVPKDSLFFEGIEIEIKIPQELLSYRGSVAYSLYEDVSPLPSDNQIDYAGNRVFVEGFPPRLSIVLKVPTVTDHSIEPSPYSTVLPVYKVSADGQIFLRLQPVMKGLPLDIEDMLFDVTVKPLLTNEGLLDLQVVYPPESTHTDFFLFINEEPVPFNQEPLMLPVGMHHLSIVSEYFRNEVRTFSVNQAESTTVSVELKDIAPTLFVTAPDNAVVYVNDVVTEFNKVLVLSPGDYKVRIVVGDYEVVKTITAVPGKSYEATLSVDVLIKETP